MFKFVLTLCQSTVHVIALLHRTYTTQTVVILCYILWYGVAWVGTHDPSDGDDGVWIKGDDHESLKPF